MRGRPMRIASYTCPALFTHHDTEGRVRRWRTEAAARGDEDARKKIEAHDDYLAGMELFRERIQKRLTPYVEQADAGNDHAMTYILAVNSTIREMDRALLDIMQKRYDDGS